MVSLWAGLEDRLSDAIDQVFGETFVHLPMRSQTPLSRREADPERASAPFQAVIDDRNPGSSSFARLGSRTGGIAGEHGAPQFTASNPMLFLEERRLPGGLPRRLDRIRRQATGDVYEVADVAKDGQGRWKLTLVKVARD